ncbi:MAG: prolyl aminopeptidase, partial [Patescibacteria group bacterium]
SDIHTLYIEQSGNPDGKPVVFLHGGPGGKIKPKHRRYFNPEKYRIILFDQRGCGQSTPMGELKENTTADLVEDIEKIRKHLGVEKWMVLGGSWGSTLALVYAETHPEVVTKMILRGIYLSRKSDLEWDMGRGGVRNVFPDEWEEFTKILSDEEKKDVLQSYITKVLSDDPRVYEQAIEAVSRWDEAISSILPEEVTTGEPELLPTDAEKNELIASYKIAFHYFKHACFLRENQLIDEVEKIRHIPAAIIHGRYDMVCPFVSAWELHKHWPEAEFCPVNLAGHRAENTQILDKVVEYADLFVE